jgi:aarF domain-containing kinase
MALSLRTSRPCPSAPQRPRVFCDFRVSKCTQTDRLRRYANARVIPEEEGIRGGKGSAELSSLASPGGGSSDSTLDITANTLYAGTDVYIVKEFWRGVEITLAALYFFGVYFAEKVNSSVNNTDLDKEKIGLVLQEIVTKLGPTFVKLAQTASMRPDLVGEEYSKSLAKLQDAVQPFGNAEAYSILESELGKPILDVFESLSEDPLASASMGQVYRGTLRVEYGGKQVAVKIRRPGVYDTIKTDIGLLRTTVGIFQKLAGVTRDLRVLVDDLGQGLLGECDFRNEVRNSQNFLKAHKSLTFITIPSPLEDLCTDRVLISEWIDGKSPLQLVEEGSNTDGKVLNLVRMGIQCSLSQLLVTGCMHGDPHSGNLLLTEDGRLCYLDFGLLVYVPPSERSAMMAALVHLGLGEWDRLVGDLEKLELLKPGTDKVALAKDLKKEFTEVMMMGESSDKDSCDVDLELEDEVQEAALQLPLLSLQTTKLSFSTLIGVLFKLAFKYKFLLPSFFPLVVRSVSSLEGVALSVDPEFKLVAAGMPVVLNQLLSDRRPESEKLLKELLFIPGQQDALRADETTRQILQVWLSAAQQANKMDTMGIQDAKEDQVLSETGLSKSTAIDMKNILLDKKNVPLRKILMMANPASTISVMPKESRDQLLKILTEILSSDAAGELASEMLDSTPEARAQRKRLAMLVRASVPKVLDSPKENIFDLIKFSAMVLFAFLKGIYARCIKAISRWFGSGSGSDDLKTVGSSL